jgi:predicted nucleotidyltransferase
MNRSAALDAARALVAEQFPDAVQAWLAGSTTTGRATGTSDLDITVLRHDGDVYRASVEYAGWPVELFVHTPASVAHFVAKDLERRHPTMARLVATGVPLLDESRGVDVRRSCEQALERGPGPVTPDQLELMRYGLTDQLDDLVDVGPGPEAAAVALGVWQATAELALAVAETWSGTGKWLVRELQALDDRDGTHLAIALDTSLRRALAGERGSLTSVADEVLGRCGGRHWVGLIRVATLP